MISADVMERRKGAFYYLPSICCLKNNNNNNKERERERDREREREKKKKVKPQYNH